MSECTKEVHYTSQNKDRESRSPQKRRIPTYIKRFGFYMADYDLLAEDFFVFLKFLRVDFGAVG